MDKMDPFVLLILILIILVVAGIGLALLVSNKSAKKDRQASVIQGKAGSAGTVLSEQADQSKRREDLARKLKGADDEEKKKKKNKRSSLSQMLVQSGLPINLKQYWLFSFLFGMTLALIAQILGQSAFVVLMVFITGCLGLPRSYIKFKIKRRQRKFLEEFADALEAMTRLLKSGMPVSEAIAMAGREYADGPVGEEMMRVYESQRVGVPLSEAVTEAAKRMPLTEMQMFATGISIQSQTGSSLSEVLLGLAGVIRARFRLKRKVQALSSEAKASAMIIGSLPFLVGGGLFAINPEYIDVLFNTLIGQIMIGGCVVWMGIGIFVMKAMINFRI